MYYILHECLANALSNPPEEYDYKIKTQRNCRELAQAVEHGGLIRRYTQTLPGFVFLTGVTLLS